MNVKSPDWAHKLVQRHACAARALEHMYTEKNVKRLIEVGAELEAALAAIPSDAAQAPSAVALTTEQRESLEHAIHNFDRNRFVADAKNLRAILAAPVAPAAAAPMLNAPEGEDPMKHGDRSIEASVRRLTEAYCKQQPLPIPDQMALVWRFDIGRLRNDWIRLNAWQKSQIADRRPAKSHCQNGGDVCLAGNRDGICCPEDSCDIDDGVRKDPTAAAHTDKRAAFEAWAKSRRYDLTRCSTEAYAAYKSDLTEGAWSGWLAAPQLSTETVDKPVQRMSDAERDVRAERARQVTVEGWTPNHDDHHDEGQLAAVAGYYALACSFPHSRDLGLGQVPAYWPWDKSWWKPTTARRNLVKAGALIIAEIERIDRAESGNESADAQDGAQ